MAITIFIIDDHPLAVAGLTNMLKPFDQFKITGKFCNSHSLLETLKVKQPDILLLDILMPDTNGRDLAELITKSYPSIRIITITSLDTPIQVKSMFKAGCMGYLLKDIDTDTLVEAIETVHAGTSRYIDATIKEKMMDNLLNFKKKQEENTNSAKIHLTRREKEVLELMAQERTNKEIADILYLSIRTVENHRLNLLRKLDVKTPIGIIKTAIDMGLI